MCLFKCKKNYRSAYKDRLHHALENTVFQTSQGITVNMEMIVACFHNVRDEGRHLFFIGNGGSAGIAIHMTADFLKNGRMRTVSMFNPATLTCLGNDFGMEYIFSKQLEILANSGDLLVAISSSGNSLDILQGIEESKRLGCHIITLTGFRENNKVRQMGEINIYVPSMEYGVVESIHNMILQQTVDMIMEKDEEESKE